MMSRTVAWFTVILLCSHWLHAAAPDLSAELPRVRPRSPEESAAMIRTIPGFKAELVAAEPLVFSPVAMDFDEDGRAYVCEMIDYPFWEDEPLGDIAVLEDTDGDGKFDKRTVLADKLHWPTAVLCYDGGCYITSAPDLYYLKDTDGDGKADVRKKLFTGFGTQNVQGLVNSLRWGIDCRIHGATGTNGGSVRRADLPADDPKNKPLNLRGRDFSFDARKLDLRPESGGGQYGMCFDDFGRKFVCSNSDHIQQIVYEDRYANLNPYVQLPPARVSIAADGPQAQVFRISPVEPWRIVRTRMRVSGEVKGLIEGGGQPAGYFTGATGITIYRGDAFPKKFRGNAFIGDVGSNLVHRKIIKPTDGVLLRAERADQGREFLASEDIWFRPANFTNGPDGCLYVLDVCREVIEHPDSLPDQIKKYLDLTSGRDRGRIYRVVPDDYERHRRPTPHLSNVITDELLKQLESENGWDRDAASRLLYQRRDPASFKKLSNLFSMVDPAELHAMYLSAELDPTTLRGDTSFRYTPDFALNGAKPNFMIHAARLSERLNSGQWPPTWDWVSHEVFLGWSEGPTHEYFLQQALTTGRLRNDPFDPEDRDLADTLFHFGDDPYVSAAALASVGRPSIAFDTFYDLLTTNRPRWQTDLIRKLAWLSAVQDNAKEAAAIARRADVSMLYRDREAAREIAVGLMEGASESSDQVREAIQSTLIPSLFAAIQADAKDVAADSEQPLPKRIDAIRLMQLGQFADAHASLEELLAGQEPQEVQLAAVGALNSFQEQPAVPEILLKTWPHLTPRLRAAALEVLLSRPSRTARFLTAVEKGEVTAPELDHARLTRLRSSKDAAVQAIATRLLEKTVRSSRADVIAAYQKTLELKGDASKGRNLFSQTCANCHRVGDVGTEIGPNLATMKSRGPEAILLNVLDPNREVNGQFVEYVVETKDGQTLSGLLSSETSAAITLLKPGGEKQTIARDQIETLRATGLSLMPEGLERQLDQQAMADLIAFLMR